MSKAKALGVSRWVVHPSTYDILPASGSGTDFAAGAVIGSTLGGAALSSRGTDYSIMSIAP